MSVESLLVQAGLGRLAPAFQDTSIERFKSLLIQDYDKFGIHDVVEKQALFKVIKSLNEEDLTLTLSPEPSASALSSQANSSPEPLARLAFANGGGSGVIDPGEDDDLLDLDDEDDDFLKSFSDAFAQSLTPERLALSASAAASTTGGPGDAASVGTPLPPTAAAAPSPPGAALHRTTSTAASGGAVASPPVTTNAHSADDAAALAALADPPRIRVIVRKRPLNRKETERGDADVLQCEPAHATLYVHEPKTKVDLTKYTESHAFTFDDVFDQDVDNDEVYGRAVRPLIATLFRAGKGTCFAYGQTGSGKTYTMGPLPLRAASDIFGLIAAAPEYAALSLHVSCYEIYGGKLYDLLNSRQRLEVREDAKRRVQVVGLKEVDVKSLDVLLRLCDHAACARSTGQTGANDESSRSHSIMVFTLKAPAPVTATPAGAGPRPRPPPGARPGGEPEGPKLRTVGKLSFIDLAGSERGADTYDNDKQTRLEGAEINKSLLALKECIRALDAEARHIPFRGSKLTEVLRDSFIGKNARTVMIACVSPNSTSCEHTLNTLRYADRVKEIKKDGAVAAPAPAVVPPSEISEVAALLHKMPPPSVPAAAPASAGTPLQAAQAAAAAVAPPAGIAAVPAPERRAAAGQGRAAAAPPSPTKARNTPAAPTPNGFGYNGRTAPRTNGAAAAAAAPTPSRAGLPAPSPAPPPRSSSNASQPPARTASDGSGSAATAPATPAGRSRDSLDVDDAVLGPLLAAEDELIAAHRAHIETTMATVREEMELLSQLDAAGGGGASVEAYVEELSNILVEKAAAVAALQQQVTAFRRQIRAAAAAAAAPR